MSEIEKKKISRMQARMMGLVTAMPSTLCVSQANQSIFHSLSFPHPLGVETGNQGVFCQLKQALLE